MLYSSETTEPVSAVLNENPPQAMRVAHGITQAAGQPWMISRGQRKIGMQADCIQLEVENTLKFPCDHSFSLPEDNKVAAAGEILKSLIPQYDVFHFYRRPFYMPSLRHFEYPTGLDLLTLRAAGKVVVYHFRGSELRTAEAFKRLSPYHYVDENPGEMFTRFTDENKIAFRDFLDAVCQVMLVPDPELQSYAPSARIVPRAIEMAEYPYIGPKSADNPLVIHAPSNQSIKGTRQILDAVETLRAEGLQFRFQLVENLPNHEARQLYQDADIIVDQLRIGWYGVLAAEGMALGKAVACFIRDDLKHAFGELSPLQFTSPPTITQDLRTLIEQPELRERLGREGRQYCEQTHCSERVARLLKSIYEEAMANPRPVDAEKVLDFINLLEMNRQKRHAQSSTRPEQNRKTSRSLWDKLLKRK